MPDLPAGLPESPLTRPAEVTRLPLRDASHKGLRSPVSHCGNTVTAMSAAITTAPLADASGGGERLARRTGLRIALAEMLANGLGAIDVFLLLWLVLPMPEPDGDESTLLAVNASVCAAYLLVSGVVGNVWGKRTFDRVTAWLREGRQPTEAERETVLRQPLVCTGACALGWAVGAVLFTAINLPASTDLALHIGTTIVMGGLTCVAVTYLLVERVLRPVTAEALAG